VKNGEKVLKTKFGLIKQIQDIEKNILTSYLEVIKLISQNEFDVASGKTAYVITDCSILKNSIKAFVIYQVKDILADEPVLSYSKEEVEEQQQKVMQWLERIKDAASKLQKSLHEEAWRRGDKSTILENEKLLEETLLFSQDFWNFVNLLYNISIEYQLYLEQQSKERKDFEYIYRKIKLHPRIRKVSENSFMNIDYRNAILGSFIEVEKMAKEKSGINESGINLFGEIFNMNHPILKLNQLNDQSDIDEQKGFMLIFQGAHTGIRNPRAHDTIVENNAYRTIHYLCLASLLATRIEESTKT
jgi:uncharacterized protein (TIGR02391 family)